MSLPFPFSFDGDELMLGSFGISRHAFDANGLVGQGGMTLIGNSMGLLGSLTGSLNTWTLGSLVLPAP